MSYDTLTKQFVGDIAAQEVVCWCGIRFAVPATLYQYYERANEHAPRSFSLHCPLGHGMVPSGKAELEKLREQLERANSRAANWQRSAEIKDRQIAARKGQITKLKNRVAAGVCPCCARTFQNLARHMQGQHPAYAAPEEE